MLMKMVKKGNEIERLAAAVSLPDKPSSLTLAENTLSTLLSDKIDADGFVSYLENNFNRVGMVKPDGTPIQANDGNALAEATLAARALAYAVEEARRDLNGQQRAYGEAAEQHIKAGCEAVVGRMLDKLDELEQLLDIMSDVQTEAAARRVTVPIRAVSSPLSNIAYSVRALRAALRSRP